MSSILADPTIRAAMVSISIEQYRRMGAAGIIEEQTELIDGVILQKMIKSPLHTLCVKNLVNALQPQLPAGFELRKEEPLTLSNSEPEPDIAIVEAGSYESGTSHPTTAALVIEVAISSESVDRGKAPVFAQANINEYWLMLPERGVIDRFRETSGDSYRTVDSVPMDSVMAATAPLNLSIDTRSLCKP